MLIKLQGRVEQITYTNEGNGFTVARVKVPGRQDLVCVVENLMGPITGEMVRMPGERANRPKIDEQFDP